MKKTAVILMGLCLIQSTNNSYAIGVPAVAAKVARSITGAITKVSGAVGYSFYSACHADAITTFKGIIGLYGMYCIIHKIFTFSEKVKKQQEADFSIASKKLMDLLVKHANEKVGELGIPEVCEQSARELMLLPNGMEEFKRVVGVYINYLKDKGSAEVIEIKSV